MELKLQAEFECFSHDNGVTVLSRTFRHQETSFFFPRQEVCQLFQNPLKSSFGKAGTNTTKLHIVAVVMKDTGY